MIRRRRLCLAIGVTAAERWPRLAARGVAMVTRAPAAWTRTSCATTTAASESG